MKTLTLAALMLITTNLLAQGHDVGNGGGAIVCADSAGQIQHAKLLDLWEFEAKYPGSIIRTEVSKALQLQNAVERLAKYDVALAAKVEKILSTLDSKKVDLDSKQGILAPPTDTLIKAIKTTRNCPLSGAALYDDKKDTLTIDQEVLSAMGQTDLAALDFHEALYKAQRNGVSSPDNSVSARLITGAIFSNLTRIPGYESPSTGLEKATFHCSSEKGDSFYILPVNADSYRIQLLSVDGERVFDRTYFDVQKSNTFGGEMVSRLSNGFAKSDRIANYTDLSGRDLQPYTTALTKQSYGPEFKIQLNAYDSVEYKKCIDRSSCRVWKWEKLSRMFNLSVELKVPGRTKTYSKISCIEVQG